MLNKRLLVCICFHYSYDRISILEKVIEILSDYKMKVDVIIDTNQTGLNLSKNDIIKQISVNDNLEHPYNLTFMHRKHIIENIDSYDWFMYLEDDMGLPFENFLEFTENFYSLWPNYVPSFVRIETFNQIDYVVDVIQTKNLNNLIKIKEKYYVDLSNGRQNITHAYHAFWIMPKKELKETMNTIKNGFFRVSIDREWAASFTNWELEKIPLVRIENNKISKLCYSYHLSNNYVRDNNTPVAKIEVDKIFNS